MFVFIDVVVKHIGQLRLYLMVLYKENCHCHIQNMTSLSLKLETT